MKSLASALALSILIVFAAPSAAASPKQEGDPTIGLALGSGGAGGLAHISMLRVFEELDTRPDRIAGTSIGAIIGALYAAGLSADEIHAIFEEFNGSESQVIFRLMRPSAELTLIDLLNIDLANGGLIDPSGFIDFIAGRVEARSFDDLEIPLVVVATDYWSGETVTIDEGDLFSAIKASMAVPGLFKPVVKGDRLLIDGGTSNPLPFDLLQGDYDLVVAVDVSGSRTPTDSTEAEWLDLLFGTFTIMQQSMIAHRLERNGPDIYIKPSSSNVRMLHFNRIEAILEQAEEAADELKQELSRRLAATPQ
ncbi:Patatin [Alkalilimnicola ehrlichii]|uniref:Patatin n=1 Tax=Alkalilimnicola ehrlichii TaxID=351052 RepID=A0A3E0WPK0_9GAMM|nr:patatin-like phospholipase family protein [Alkalilimnicola ehrlichii]RFA26781.1 Patatin [Alkalilimnicola ehrlichii]RFA33875.1 Patatin [Alkalilimnicola ehrlichii]